MSEIPEGFEEVPVDVFLSWKNLPDEEQKAAGYSLLSEQGWLFHDATFDQKLLSCFLGGGHTRLVRRAVEP